MLDVANTLLLVPTEAERRVLAGNADWPAFERHVHLCGFGPAAAAAHAATLIARLQPRRVVLLGIAGTYHPQKLPVGEAAVFSRVSIDGIGAGEGNEFLSASELGFPHWGASPSQPTPADDQIVLDVPDGEPDGERLLTVCSASAGVEAAQRRAALFDDATAEDMEAYGVALACRLAEVSLTVVRGISNLAGNRDIAHWHIDAALESAWHVCRRFLG